MNFNEKALPLIALRGTLVFPHMVTHLDVGRDKSIQAVEQAMTADKYIFLATQKEPQADDPDKEDIYDIGTVAEIKQLLKLPGGNIRILVEGIVRAKVVEYQHTDPYFRVLVKGFTEEFDKSNKIEALMRNLAKYFEQYVKISKRVSPETAVSAAHIDDPSRLADTVASHLAIRIADKQDILETIEVKPRLEKLCNFLVKELEIVELERKINMRVRKQMEKTQKEYYLREQIKAIQKELGDKEDRAAEATELREKVKKLKMPKETKEKIMKEIAKLERMPHMSAEIGVLRNYLEWVISLPWSKTTRDKLNIKRAEKILNEDHYGLEKPKERIVEYLAIQQLTKKIKGSIICFAGPPGVGKTSLGRSIARALGRKFVRISLGGVRDEAEIRGHRRTYVGAMPGRIIQGLKNAGTKNPVFLLDEIDKMSADFRGDPSAALLEVLDPEQNRSFSDHYIEVPFDLSNVMFITTANNIYNIPRPLLDRMEVINIAGYTEEEKIQIAVRYLLPKQIKKHGLPDGSINISENTIRKVIQEYTRESGVRNLERNIAALCRKAAKQIVTGKNTKVNITTQNLQKYLGAPKYHYNIATKSDEIGAATGLAWTEVGGDTLTIEVIIYKGTGKLTLTGKLGDVMKESAQAAFSYIRSRADVLNIDEKMFKTHDVHIHVPEGAIPKDGPSAGITIATALASAMTKRKVKCNIAMTGEITLRGKVLKVGGIKEKVLAAKRAGIKTVILPAENKVDIKEVTNNVKNKMEFKFVDHMDDVLDMALCKPEAEICGECNIPPQVYKDDNLDKIDGEEAIIPS